MWIWVAVFVLSSVLLALSYWNIPRWLWVPRVPRWTWHKAYRTIFGVKAPSLERRILRAIITLEGKEQIFNRRVWDKLLDVSPDVIDDRLKNLANSDLISIGEWDDSLQGFQIYGVTPKGHKGCADAV